MLRIHISRGGDLCAPQMARENLNLKAFLGVLTLIPTCIHLTSKIDSVYLGRERGDDYVINANGFLEAREGSAFVSGQLFTRDEPKHTMYGIAFEQYSEECIGLLSAGRFKNLPQNLQAENEGERRAGIMDTGAFP